MKTKVRVKRAALVTVVEGRTRKAEKEYARAVAAYPAAVAKWEADCSAEIRKVAAGLERTAAAIENGRIKVDRRGNPEVKYAEFPDRPIEPSEGRELCALRRMLATLKMGSDDTILLSQEDADAYFGPCDL
jgi:hypothetical protein